eukprot:3766272-Prorocentrum_lima.AAC.1
MRDQYFERRALTGNIPMPTWDTFQRILIRAAGSAPGLDGMPYKVLHAGSSIVTAVVGQAVYQADTQPDRCE